MINKAPTKLSDLRFYKNYTIIMLVVFLAILLSLSAFFGKRLNELFETEVTAIEFYVDENGQLLDYVFRSALDQLEIISLDLELKSEQSGQCTSLPTGILNAHQFTRTEQGFELSAPSESPWLGSLIGAGTLNGRSEQFYCDLESTLLLRENFRNLPVALSGLSNAYFISANDFYLVAPGNLGDLPKVTELRDDLPAFFQAIRADSHPPQTLQQSQVHNSFKNELGPIIPVSTALFLKGRFIGSLSIGLSVEFINRMNLMHHYPNGTSYIADQSGEILTHPAINVDPTALTSTYTGDGSSGTHLFAPINLLDEFPHAKATIVDKNVIVVYRLKTMPWHLAFVVPKSQIHAKVLRQFGPGMLGVLLGLAILMITSYLVTSRYFVRPAAKLVTHVAHESNLDPQPIPDVPAVWRPWFEVITRAFHESVELVNLQREIDIAARLQASLLPRKWPEDQRYEIWGKMTPAKYVGGDFYDHLQLDSGDRALTVADVSGKGIPAGLFGMVSKTYMRSLAMYGLVAVNEILQRVNNRLFEDNDTCMFVTVVYGQYNPNTGVVSLANAGHPPQLLISAKGELRWIAPKKSSPALGIVQDATYEQTKLQLQPGDQLLMFSDGVNEAMNPANEEFGFERLAALFEGQPTQSARATVERVFAAIETHERETEQSDDITCMVLHRLA